MKRLGLGKCIPKKKKKEEEVVKSLAATINREINNWDFEKVCSTESTKKEMIALMVEVLILLLISMTCYSFGG